MTVGLVDRLAQQGGVGHVHGADECRLKVGHLHSLGDVIEPLGDGVAAQHPHLLAQATQGKAQGVVAADGVTVGITMRQQQNIVRLHQEVGGLLFVDEPTHWAGSSFLMRLRVAEMLAL